MGSDFPLRHHRLGDCPADWPHAPLQATTRAVDDGWEPNWGGGVEVERRSYHWAMPFDTDADALTVQREVWRRMGPAGRVTTAVEMSESMRRFALAGIKARHPEFDTNDALRHLIRDIHGIDVTA